MILTRCWLEHLFNCAFEDAYFGKSFLNPEMFQLLFDDDKTIPYQFHVECFRMKPVNNNFGNILKFAFNHLAITETLLINFDGVDNADIDSLMSILINKGGELQQIYYSSLKLPTLYNLIIK
uniref:Uncharacterized protein n=1 Tax=Meloidogyne hapla TaxID=6305 RepID=A0A1I8BQZ6_MELHA